MRLERLMTLEVDLPDAPAGCEWRLFNDEACPQVQLVRDGQPVGLLTFGCVVHDVAAYVYATETTMLRATALKAALALFSALDLEVGDE